MKMTGCQHKQKKSTGNDDSKGGMTGKKKSTGNDDIEGGEKRQKKSTGNDDGRKKKTTGTGNDDSKGRKARKKKSTSNNESKGGKARKKKSTSYVDSKGGKKRKKKSTGNDDSRKKKTTGDAKNAAVVSERRNTRSNPTVNKSGGEKIPKALASHNTAGPGEKQEERLNNPGLCNITGCKVNTFRPLKCDTSYDSTMNYADRCKKVCHRECANEAHLTSDFNDTILYCSKECKKKGDKYRDEELRNEKPKTGLRAAEKNSNNNNNHNNNNNSNNNNKSTRTSGPGRRGGSGGGIGISRCSFDEDFILSQDTTTTGGGDDDDDDTDYDDHDPTEDYELSSGTAKQGRGTSTRKSSSKKNSNTSTDSRELLTNGVFPVSLRVGWQVLERANGAVRSPKNDNEYIHFVKSNLTTNSTFDELTAVIVGCVPAGKQLFEKSGCSFFYNKTEKSVDPCVTTDMKTKKDTSYHLTSKISNKEDYCTAINMSSLRLNESKLPDDSPITIDAACEKDNDELDDECDNNNDSPVVFHLDVVVLICDKPGIAGGKALTNKKTHSKIKCIVLNVTAKVIDKDDGDEQYMISPRKGEAIGSFLVDRDKFCGTVKYGSIRQQMLKLYSDADKGDLIGEHSSIFIKYDNRSNVMNRVTSSQALFRQYQEILDKQTSKAVDNTFTIKLSLGKKKNNDPALDYDPAKTQLHHNESQQMTYQSPAKEAFKSRAARRNSSRVLSEDNSEILDLFEQVKELEKFKNKMAQQHKVVFLLHLGNHADEKERIESDLLAGHTPKLLFMKQYAKMLRLIMPGDRDFGPTAEGGVLPDINEVGNAKDEDDPFKKLASSIGSLVESKKTAAAPPKANAICFIKYGDGIKDSFTPGDVVHEVSILASAVDEDNGHAMLLAALQQAQQDGSLIFSCNGKTDKSFNRYKFRGQNPSSDQLKAMTLEFILTGTKDTLEIIITCHEKKDIVQQNVLI